MHENLKKVFDEIRIDKKVSLDQMNYFVKEFDERFWKALQKVLEHGVKKYTFSPSNRTAWIVVGNKRDYLIISDLYCSCEDFYLNVVVRKAAKMCYHLLSKVLATTFEEYEQITVEDERYDQLMKDWKRI
jgi:predicted nucleic acid-binding Zn finger protein